MIVFFIGTAFWLLCWGALLLRACLERSDDRRVLTLLDSVELE